MKQADYERRHRHRISTDLTTDIVAAKLFCLDPDPDEPKSATIKGYIQLIVLDPFGYLLLSNYQVRSYWKRIYLHSTN